MSGMGASFKYAFAKVFDLPINTSVFQTSSGTSFSCSAIADSPFEFKTNHQWTKSVDQLHEPSD